MKDTFGTGWGGLTAIIGFILGLSYLLALWTERSAEFWLELFKGEAVDVPLWLAWIASIILNGIIFAANVITELARLAF